MKRPLKNTLSLLIGDVGSRVLGFGITVYLARVLEPSAFGVINIGFGVLGYLILIMSPGLQVLETRNAASAVGTDQKRVNSVLSLRFVLSVGLLAVTAMVSYAVISSEEIRQSIILFALSLIPLSLFLDWFFQGKEEFMSMSVARLITYLVYGTCVILFVDSTRDVSWVPIGFVAANLAATVFLFTRFRRFGKFTFVWNPHEWKGILSASVPVGIAVILAQSAMNLPPIALGWYVSTAEAGVFSSALKLVFVLLMLDRIVNALLLPAATRYYSSKREDLPFFITVVLKVVLVTILPITVCAVLLSPLAILFVFGEQYADAIPILQILLIYFLLTVINSVFVCSLLAAGKEKDYTKSLNAGSIIFVVGIFAGAMFIGSEGVAYGIVAGELCTVLLMMYRTKSVLDFHLWKPFFRPMIAAGLMIASIYVAQEQSVLVQSAVSLVVFAAVVTLSGGFEAKEIRFVRERFV